MRAWVSRCGRRRALSVVLVLALASLLAGSVWRAGSRAARREHRAPDGGGGIHDEGPGPLLLRVPGDWLRDAELGRTLADLQWGYSLGASFQPRTAVQLARQLHAERTLVVCQQDWPGVRGATLLQPNAVALMPRLDRQHTAFLLSLVGHARVHTVVINGKPLGTEKFARAVRSRFGPLRARPGRGSQGGGPSSEGGGVGVDVDGVAVLVVYHGSPAEHSDPVHARAFGDMLRLAGEGVVDRLAFVKHGTAEAVRRALGAEALFVPNFAPAFVDASVPFSLFDGRYHVGVLASFSWRKNNVVQILAACMTPGAVVHVGELPADGLGYLRSQCRAELVEYGRLGASSVRDVLGRMDVNLYVSFSECHPMMVMESLAMGVPCLTSPTSFLFDGDPALKALLVVPELDSPSAIGDRIARVRDLDPATYRPQLARLARDLQRQATKAWARFLSPPDALPRLPPPALLPAPLPRSPHHGEAVAVADAGGGRPLVVCLVGYEIGLSSGGGAGTVVDALAQALLAAGFRVLALIDVGERELNEWYEARVAAGAARSMLKAYHLPALQGGNDFANVFVSKAVQFSLALERLYAVDPFDLVEIHEYCGTALNILRRKLADPGGAVLRRVPVALRLHGALELIQVASVSRASPLVARDGQDAAMLAMERVGLRLADFLLAPAEDVAALYRRAYRSDFGGRMRIVAPPFDAILAGFDRLPRRAAGDHVRLLIYGRVHVIKAVGFMINATVAAMRRHPRRRVSVLIVGHDQLCPSKPEYSCLRTLIPYELQERFRFRGRIRRTQLLELAPTTSAAVFASKFETACMAVHELHRLGVPLVIRRGAPFDSYFDAGNALMYDPGSHDGLVAALGHVIEGSEAYRAVAAAPALTYAFSPQSYRALVDEARGGDGPGLGLPRRPDAALRRDLALVTRLFQDHVGVEHTEF